MRSRQLRLLFTLALGITLLIAAALPVSAQTTVVRQTSPAPPFFIPAGETGCAFDVSYDPGTNGEMLTTFTDSAGNVKMQIVTGRLTARVTNLSTGKYVDVNISGPGKFVPQPDGSLRIYTGGPTFWWFSTPGVAAEAGQPNVAIYWGKTISEFDADGNYHFLQTQGRVQDMCATLAG